MKCLVCHMEQSGPHKMDCHQSERDAAARRQETLRATMRVREEAHSKALVRARNEGLELAAKEADAAALNATETMAITRSPRAHALLRGGTEMATDLAVMIRRKKEPEQ